MKNLIMLLLCVHISFLIHAQNTKVRASKSSTVINNITRLSLTPEAWEFQQDKITFLRHKGVDAVKLDEKSGSMLYRNLNFTNGTIEFDVEVDRPQPFPSVYFRFQNPEETELVYLRCGAAGKKNASDAVQYASIIKGVNLWDVQYEYQSAADIKVNEWNHVKIVVSGKQLKVYVNNQAIPNLEIPCMEGNTADGKVGIGTGFPGNVIFSNITVSQNVEGLSPEPGADVTAHDTRYIRKWQISAPDSLNYGREVGAFMIPKNDSNWQTIQAERRGLINLSRKFGGTNSRRFIWLRTTINSEFNQSVLMKLGFSDEVWVFVNQRPVYVDKNIYYQNMRKSPSGRISIDNASFALPLSKGNNELLIALANDFYGWGLMARLEHLEGIEF